MMRGKSFTNLVSDIKVMSPNKNNPFLNPGLQTEYDGANVDLSDETPFSGGEELENEGKISPVNKQARRNEKYLRDPPYSFQSNMSL